MMNYIPEQSLSQVEESPMMMNKIQPCFNKKLLPQYQHPMNTDLFNLQQSHSLDSYRTAADSGSFPLPSGLMKKDFQVEQQPQAGQEDTFM